MMAATISAYQLTEVANVRPIEVHVAINGAMISMRQQSNPKIIASHKSWQCAVK